MAGTVVEARQTQETATELIRFHHTELRQRIAAISTGGAALAGRTMMRAVHYKRVAIVGTLSAVVIAPPAGAALFLAPRGKDRAGDGRVAPRERW